MMKIQYGSTLNLGGGQKLVVGGREAEEDAESGEDGLYPADLPPRRAEGASGNPAHAAK